MQFTTKALLIPSLPVLLAFLSVSFSPYVQDLTATTLSACVQCALQVSNSTPFTQGDEAMQSAQAVEKIPLIQQRNMHTAGNVGGAFI